MPVRSGCSENRTANVCASGKSRGRPVTPYRKPACRLVSIVARERDARIKRRSWTLRKSIFHGRVSPPTKLFPNRFCELAVCALCTLRLAFPRSKNRLCASARLGGGNEHRGHGCTHRVILYLYSRRVKPEETFVECKSQLVTSDRDAIDIAT